MGSAAHDLTDRAVTAIAAKAGTGDVVDMDFFTFLALVRIAEDLEALLARISTPPYWFVDIKGGIQPMYGQPNERSDHAEGHTKGNTEEGPTEGV